MIRYRHYFTDLNENWNVEKHIEGLIDLGFSIGENTGSGVKNLGGFLGPIVPFVLNLFKPESVQGTAPTAPSVANQTVSIDAVNMNNPYMMITPEIYGMYAV